MAGVIMTTTVSVREFSYNPSAMFARAEKGETIEVTRHGRVIATLLPARPGKPSPIAELEAAGALRRSGKTTSDLNSFTQITLPDGGPDPLQVLLEDRHAERDWERELGDGAS